jgi:hypothetical protein
MVRSVDFLGSLYDALVSFNGGKGTDLFSAIRK